MNYCLLLYHALLYCISVLHMTKPAVSRMHYQSYMYQRFILSVITKEVWAYSTVSLIHRLKLDCCSSLWPVEVFRKTFVHFGTNMCFIPQKLTIKIAISNKGPFKLFQHRCARFWLSAWCRKKQVQVACDMVLISPSTWVVYKCNLVYGRLLSYYVYV